MVHPGCGADIIRQRRRKDTLKKEQNAEVLKKLLEQQDALYAKNTLARAKNKRYHGHYTPARDSQVFNKQRCSSLRLNAINNDNNKYVQAKNKKIGTKKLTRHNSNPVPDFRSLKHQEGYRSKSFEQETPPICLSGGGVYRCHW